MYKQKQHKTKTSSIADASKNTEGFWKDKYIHLLEEIKDFGFKAHDMLSQVQKDRLFAMEYLRSKHGNLKITPNTLYKLKDKLKRECKDYLYVRFGNNPRVKTRIDEVFAKPKPSRKRYLDEFLRSNRKDLTEGESCY